MHVQNVAVYDLELDPTELHDLLVHGRTATEAPRDGPLAKDSVSGAARENLAQYCAVAGICNAATFAAQSKEKPSEIKDIIGDATGE